MSDDNPTRLPIVITDNHYRARVDFPGCEIVTRTADVLAMDDDREVLVRPYRVGAERDDAVQAARVLIAKGLLKEAAVVERPLWGDDKPAT